MQVVEGTIASAPDSDGRVLVAVDDFDDAQPVGPCPITPRADAPPEEGMRCVVALADSSRTALTWVLSYEP